MTVATEKSLRNQAADIVRRLQVAGFAAFWVGGCVRDFLLGRDPGDYDIATSALPEHIEKLFQRTIAVGRNFGVIIVVEGGHQFQVATFRAEADYRDGRHPEHVTFGDARADASRRDFTVNGLFFDPVAEKLHDWVGGETDLRAKVIRTIGAPTKRFAEDHLRLLRAVRFAVQLDFEIERETFAALQANAPKIKSISAERVREELIKLFLPSPGSEGVISLSSPKGGEGRSEEARLLKTETPLTLTLSPLVPRGEREKTPVQPSGLRAARGLELLRESGLLEQILPELAATVHCEQSPDFHPEGSVFNHLLLMFKQMPADADPLLPWAVLMHDIAKPLTASRDANTGSIHFYEHEKIGAEMAEEILERLRFPRKQIEAVAATVRHHMQFKDALKMRKSTLRRLLMRETFPLELALHRLDCLGSHGRLDVYDFLVEQSRELEQQPEIRPPLLTGDELIALGMRPGPELGALLAELREKQLQDELKTPAEARAWVKRRI
jgi:putative nucleotidyltransferase with HDIG domain